MVPNDAVLVRITSYNVCYTKLLRTLSVSGLIICLSLKAGFSKVFEKRKFFGKLFLVAYFAISGLVVVNLATFGSITAVDESAFLTMSKDMVGVMIDDDLSREDVLSILSSTSADMIMSVITSYSIHYTKLYDWNFT